MSNKKEPVFSKTSKGKQVVEWVEDNGIIHTTLVSAKEEDEGLSTERKKKEKQ